MWRTYGSSWAHRIGVKALAEQLLLYGVPRSCAHAEGRGGTRPFDALAPSAIGGAAPRSRTSLAPQHCVPIPEQHDVATPKDYERFRRRSARDLPAVIDVTGYAEEFARLPSEIGHPAILPQEGVLDVYLSAPSRYSVFDHLRLKSVAHHLPAVVDGKGYAEVYTRQRSEVGHPAFLPQEGMHCIRVRRTYSHDLPTVVDADG